MTHRELIHDNDRCSNVCRSLLAYDRLFDRSVGTSDIECKAGAHCTTMTPRAAYAPVLFRNADDNKDNNSILLSTFALSPFLQEDIFWRDVPPSDPRATQCATFAPFHLNLMHRGITKRISDLNTGDIMREIKLAATLYHE